MQAHQSGKLSEAEGHYRKIITQDPKNFDALHTLGIVCSSTGKIQEADGYPSIPAFRLVMSTTAFAFSNKGDLPKQ
ncbi:MAG: tetratricopeptide repeat protein [Pseudolabrys sp.]